MTKKEEAQQIRIEDFDYPLPDERIAKFPLAKRDESKLLLYKQGEIGETQFKLITRFLPAGSLMVFNNTRVIQARLLFRKPTGARIEVFCLEPVEPHDYDQVNLVGVHILHQLAERLAFVERFAGGNPLIHIHPHQYKTVLLCIGADVHLLRFQREAPQRLLGGRDSDIARSADYLHDSLPPLRSFSPVARIPLQGWGKMDENAVRNLYEALARIISLREGVTVRVVSVCRRDAPDGTEKKDIKNTSEV